MKRNIIPLLIFLFLISCTSFQVSNLYKKATRLIAQEQYEDAEDILNEILTLDNKYTKAYISRALIRYINNDIDLAIGDLLIAINLEDRNYIAHYNLGNLYFKKSNFEDAIMHYSIAISCNRSFSSAYLNRANTYMKLERYEDALKDYRYFITISDNQKENITKLIKILEEDLNSK